MCVCVCVCVYVCVCVCVCVCVTHQTLEAVGVCLGCGRALAEELLGGGV